MWSAQQGGGTGRMRRLSRFSSWLTCPSFGVGHVLCSHYIKKYNRYEKRHKNVPAHCSPAFKLNVGDNIIVGQCRPLSKTVRFNVLSVVSEAAGAKAFSKY